MIDQTEAILNKLKESMDVPVYVENEFPDHVAVEPECIVNTDGSIKFTGFGLVRR